MITEIIEFMAERPEWLVILAAIVRFISRFFKVH